MKSKVEKIENSKDIKLEITVEAEKFDAAINNVFKQSAKYFNIPGFRKGKAPMSMVEKVYGTEIFYEDAFNEVVPEAYEEALKENNIDAVSRPNIDVVQIGKGKDLIFTAVVSVKPEVKLGKYKGVAVEKTVYTVSEEDVEKQLNQMADRNSRMVTVEDRAAELGDTAVIDFVGSVDGVEFDGGKAENHELELGSGSFIPGFEDQVVGMKTEEVKDVNVTFPEEYFSKDLAGKAAVFKVTLHEIKRKELPAIDDDFAKDVSEFDSLEELKADIKAKKEEENAVRTKNEVEEAVVKAVSETAEVEIPQGMIDLEIDNIAQDMDRRLSYQGINLEQYLQMVGQTMADFRTQNTETAVASIKYRLVLEAVCEDAKIEVTDEEVAAKVTELAATYGRKEEELKENEALLENIKDSLKSEKAIALLVENAKVKEVAEKKEEKTAKKTTAKKSTAKKEEKVEEAAEAAEEKEAKKTTTKKSTKKAE